MAGFSNLFGGLPAQLITSLLGYQEQRKNWEDAREANLGRYDEGLGNLRGLIERSMGGYGGLVGSDQQQRSGLLSQLLGGSQTLGQNLLQGQNRLGQSLMQLLAGGQNQQTQKMKALGQQIPAAYRELGDQIQNQFTQRGAELTAGYNNQQAQLGQFLGDRRNQILGDIDRLGGQERADINQRYDQQASTQRANAISRGLATGAGNRSIGYQAERERTDAMGRLEDRLRQQRIGADTILSGDIANQQQRASEFATGLQDTYQRGGINAAGQFGNAAVGAQNQLGQAAINLLGQQYTQRLGLKQQTGQNRLATQERYGQQGLGYQSGLGLQNIQNQTQLGMGQIDLDRQLTGDINSWIYNRSDPYPPPGPWSTLAGLSQQAGQQRAAQKAYNAAQPEWYEGLFGLGAGAATSFIPGVGPALAPFVGGAVNAAGGWNGPVGNMQSYQGLQSLLNQGGGYYPQMYGYGF